MNKRVSTLLLIALPLIFGQVPRIPNGIIGEPEVICDIRHIHIKVRTMQEFSGNLYSKGFFHKKDCKIRGRSGKKEAEIVLPVDSDCGIRRKRVTTPRGILLDTTIVLMFHPVFLTQNDRSYHVRCQYFESDRTVTNALDVSMQPATELPQTVQNDNSMSAPICKYEVLMGSETGPPLTHATVGDAVYHRWFCIGENKESYCMTVHSCVVDDGQGYGQKLVDDQGCAIDDFLLKQLEYKDDLSAGQLSNVFKFADKPTIFFSCMIRVEMKEASTTKCANPSKLCEMRKTEKSTADSLKKSEVMTPNRFTNDIPDDFPRPKNETKFNKKMIPSKIMNSPSNNDYSENADDDPFPMAPNIPHATMARLIRRDLSSTNHRILADIDVSAPSVDVIDIPETNVGQPPNNEDNNKLSLKFGGAKNEWKKNGDVCISMISVILYLIILLIFSILSIIFIYLVMSKLFGKEANTIRQKVLPHPNFSFSA